MATNSDSALLWTSDKPFSAIGKDGDGIVIRLPSMPESLDLLRESTYKVVSNIALPDGFHIYQSTSPLKIPFSFKAHFTDTENGSKGLVELSAKLHSLSLPLRQGGIALTTQNSKEVKEATNQAKLFGGEGGKYIPAFPPVCHLMVIMMDGSEDVGINCRGYVQNVSAKLKGPWLTSQGGGRNLPTSGEYSFNFVHVPTHSNSVNLLNIGETTNFQGGEGIGEFQAFSEDVWARFYNNQELGNTAQAHHVIAAPIGVIKGFFPNKLATQRGGSWSAATVS